MSDKRYMELRRNQALSTLRCGETVMLESDGGPRSAMLKAAILSAVEANMSVYVFSPTAGETFIIPRNMGNTIEIY